MLADAAARRLVVGVRGAGTKVGLGGAGRAGRRRGRHPWASTGSGSTPPVTWSSPRRPGSPLAALQEHVAPAAQWLALDPPELGATVGGVVATAASGPRRLLYGTPRDLLIGITVVLADGTIAHSGGKVVKNVAGYDLGKLFTGSFGTLGVIAQCTFRLHPLAVDRRVVLAQPADPAEAVRRVKASGAVPCAIEWDGETLTVVVESFESAAQVQAEEIAAAIGGEVSSAAAGRLRRATVAVGGDRAEGHPSARCAARGPRRGCRHGSRRSTRSPRMPGRACSGAATTVTCQRSTALRGDVARVRRSGRGRGRGTRSR